VSGQKGVDSASGTMDEKHETDTAPEPEGGPGLKERIETVAGLAGRLFADLIRYDQYSPGDEFRLNYTNGSFFSLVERLLPIIRWYFRYEVIGLENVPPRGRAVLVSNHGILPVDALLLHYAIKDAFGRWPRGLTDKRIFKIPFLRQIFLDLGIVLAHPDTGQALLEREEMVTIMPGGSREAFKPSRERYRLMWKRRKGFVRLAIRTGSPIIPAVCIGNDELYHVFFDGYDLSERIYGKEALLPVTLPVGLGPLPLPAKLTHYVGKPIRFRYRPEDADDAKKVGRLHRRVVKAMQDLLQRGLRERLQRHRNGDNQGEPAHAGT
jgi:1-acyl-sn-glycerol-3-phosphate acyltransferase